MQRRPAHLGSADVDLAIALGLHAASGVRTRRVIVGSGAASGERLAAFGDPVVVVAGVVMRTVRLGRRESALLHGPGDVMAPGNCEPKPFRVFSRALEPAAVAVLDQDTLTAAAEVPVLARHLTDVVTREADAIGLQSVLTQLGTVPDRLRMLLPQLCDRWGSVTAEGVVLPAFLSHTVLAALIGVRRPSFTTALSELTDTGELRRLDDRRWLLAPALAGLAA